MSEPRYIVGDNECLGEESDCSGSPHVCAASCDTCGRVSQTAVIDVAGGFPTIECDKCAPELKENGEPTE